MSSKKTLCLLVFLVVNRKILVNKQGGKGRLLCSIRQNIAMCAQFVQALICFVDVFYPFQYIFFMCRIMCFTWKTLTIYVDVQYTQHLLSWLNERSNFSCLSFVTLFVLPFMVFSLWFEGYNWKQGRLYFTVYKHKKILIVQENIDCVFKDFFYITWPNKRQVKQERQHK